MEGEQNARKPHWTGFWCVAVLGLLTIGYPLSVGPVAWFAKRGYLPEDLEEHVAIRIVYAPIIWMFENCEWYNRLHLWYLSLWGI
jgi:hypothetical protein